MKEQLNVGDILYYSWGYDQTNIDFYAVTRTTAKSVWLRPIHKATAASKDEHGRDHMFGHTTPVPGTECGEEFRKRIQYHGERISLSANYGCIRLWDGSPVLCSWYA